jgi:hypothetical protein
VTDARQTLLGRLIDYAGLFPPAQLEMGEAAARYRDARLGPHAWMLDRFICPASRLEELGEAAEGERWRVSVVVDRGDLSDLPALSDSLGAAARAAGRMEVELVELRLGAGSERVPERIAALRGTAADSGLSGPVRLFVEVRPDAALEMALDALAADGLGAKIRCGGETTPSPEELRRFVEGCARRGIPWKATAGLHHPFRHHDNMSGASQHGFVNLLAAAGLAAAGAQVGEALASEDRDEFELTEHGLCWRGTDVTAGARELFVSYGSCSFDEPVDDLLAIGALPAGAQA